MSSRQYTVTVKLKDDGTLKRIENATGGGSGGSPSKGGGSIGASGLFGGGAGNSLLSKMASLSGLQLLKLGGIAGGIATIATYTVKSSSILQSVFKLWDTTAMLVFKPLGDFIGMALRPLTILMLKFGIDFYKVAGPWFLKYGLVFGNWLADQQKKTIETAQHQEASVKFATINLAGIQQGIMNWFDDADKKSAEIRDKQLKQFGEAWDAFTTGLTTKLGGIPNAITAIFGNFASDLWQKITNIPNALVAIFGGFASDVYTKLTSIPQTIYDIFSGLASDITSKLAGIPQAIWDAIMTVVRTISGGLIGGGAGAGTSPSLAGRFNGSARTQMANMASAVNP